MVSSSSARSTGVVSAKLCLSQINENKALAIPSAHSVLNSRAMGFLFHAIRYLLTAVALISWMLTAYSRAEDPNLSHDQIPLNEPLLKWGLRVSTSMMYFMATDLLKWANGFLTFWHEQPPWRRFASIFVGLLILNNLYYIMKERRRRQTLAIYCPVDNTVAFPIPGSHNRYRCTNRPRPHQFSGEPHIF